MTILAYASIWYALFLLSREDGRIPLHTALFAVIPNAFLAWVMHPWTLQAMPEESCSFIPVRLVYFCLLLSTVLLPGYALLLNTYYNGVPEEMNKKRLILIWLVLAGAVLTALLVMGMFMEDVWAYLLA
ncbi:hypothetical protein [Peribacillus sp. SCS-37]|uniref:hypothetical protein n=1 Tax=Paraperibacillus esterisolvens TaxID=3115296 RepID=UPI003906775F